MIGNLGRVAYSLMPHNAENNGNSGNIPHKPPLILNQQKGCLFPWHEVEPGTVGTQEETSTPVPTVPECLNETGNSGRAKNSLEIQAVIKSVPVVPAVPAKNRVAADKLTSAKPCYCCKGTDFWESSTKAGYFVCRKCHPPMEGAERISKMKEFMPDVIYQGAVHRQN